MLKESVKNKKNLIPDDYDSRLRTLLASLPDEPPVSDPENAEVITEVIKRPVRFNIRPLISAAAVFALTFAGLYSVRSSIQNAFYGKNDEQRSYVTTVASQTTAAETTVTEVTTEPEVTSVTDVPSETAVPAETEAGAVTEKNNESRQTHSEENTPAPANSPVVPEPHGTQEGPVAVPPSAGADAP